MWKPNVLSTMMLLRCKKFIIYTVTKYFYCINMYSVPYIKCDYHILNHLKYMYTGHTMGWMEFSQSICFLFFNFSFNFGDFGDIESKSATNHNKVLLPSRYIYSQNWGSMWICILITVSMGCPWLNIVKDNQNKYLIRMFFKKLKLHPLRWIQPLHHH